MGRHSLFQGNIFVNFFFLPSWFKEDGLLRISFDILRERFLCVFLIKFDRPDIDDE